MIAGQLEIQLLANMARLQADMREAKNTVSRAVGDLNSVLGSIGVGLSFAGVAAMVGTIVRASEEAAIAQRKLDAVIRATGNASGYTSAQLSKLADNLARTSTFDDEGFREATATLLRFGNIGGENLEKVLKLSADFAALTGGDLVSSAEKLGRALSDPVDGLGKLERNFGSLAPEVKAAIKLQMDMGNQSGALGLAIEALQKKIGGADQEMNQGLTGSIKQLKKAFGELFETLGGAANNGFLTAMIDDLAAKLRGIKALLEEGTWVQRLAAIGAVLNGNMTGAMLTMLGNAGGGSVTPSGSGPSNFSLDDQTARAEAHLRKVVEANRRAAKEIAEDNERLRQLGLKGEEAALIAEHEMLQERMLQEANLRKKGMKDAEDIRQIELGGQEGLARNVVRIVEEEERRIKEIREANSLAIWNEISDAAGSFFSDLAMNGKSAFDNLKKYLKDLLAQMIALFAKRWVLNLAAGGTMLGSAGSALAGGAGDGSIAGGLLNAASSLFGGGELGAAVGNFANMGASFLGASGSLASTIGSMASFLPAIGTAISVAVMLYNAFKDGPENPNFRWTQGQGGAGSFGGIGTEGNYNFDSSKLTAYIGSLDARFERLLGPGGAATATSALAGYTSAGRRMDGQPAQFAFPEGTDKEAAEQLAKELLQSRYSILFDQIDAELADQVRNFGGSSAELQTFIETSLAIIEGLGSLGVTGLDIDALQAMQKEGEALSDTFQRVAGQWAWFTDNFYTDAEKLELAQQQVEKVFADLGIAIPKDITEFRKLVQSIDLSTEAGRTLYQTLMGVAPAFLEVAGAADTLGGSAGDASNEVEKAARRIVDSTAQLREEARRAAEALRDAKMGLRDYLSGLLLNENLSPLTMEQQLAEAKRQYEETRDLAKGGDLGAINQLGAAFDAYLKIAREMFGSSAAYNAIFQQGFDEIRGIAGGGPNWQDAMAAAMPAAGGKLASSADIGQVNASIKSLITLLARGVRTTDPEAKAAIEGVRVELRSGRKGALAK